MASIRTVRVIAAVTALPLAATLFTGVAQAHSKPFGGDRSNASVGIIGSGVGDDNHGNSTTTRQVATGFGASNRSNTASVNRSAFTTVDQSTRTMAVYFIKLW